MDSVAVVQGGGTARETWENSHSKHSLPAVNHSLFTVTTTLVIIEMAGFAGPQMPLDPPTELGRLRILSSTAGIRVSPLALGGGNIGQAWNSSWGFMNKERAFELLDAYLEVRVTP